VTYFNVRIKSLRPAYRRDLIDHRDVLILSLGLGEGCTLYVNVYSDDNHTAITALHEGLQVWPNVHVMCGDMNVRHIDWDPEGPDRNIHAERLVASAERLGLGLCLPVEPGPTHFPFNQDLSKTVIDLMFVRGDLSLVLQHMIVPEGRGRSDHAPLVITIPGPGSLVPVTRWSIP
jgi:endonuclease/exonuclease/phosphatase family metal-dependent hydrolase